ncbi:MAG TPA: MoxR family ATPase [Candidatus Cloacimonadota bacterium]|nr:MoxR family ATPase [Candidatus Cloacimonadota bacterium]HOF59212.1 MoxR family ATPase [Candidatus Cloacimonadota bacterium]HOR58469.1 MoxR family ATPase [Candidatus Cloacimonadota bacterium]HPB08498.1 MoxR family ATPase [Candidatus Cloacimonadota bacterium]HQL13678.1 MoxR family ATPase [Candidatus Cloacimonadota bacterium]
MNSETMIQRVTELKTAKEELLKQIRKTIIGQDKVVEQVLIGLFANGHMLIEGVPGLAKTLLISTIAKALNLSFGRIQFTPDLMPSDITGSDILVTGSDTGEREFKYIKGPIFANIILADEINRTPPKTQAALLQAMQEYQVSSGNTTRPLDLPFIVMATQNPIEQEGTYPLPEAQLDRFMLYIGIDYPSYEEELAIVQSTTGTQLDEPQALLSAEMIIQFQNAIRNMPLSNHVLEYAVKLARSTRPGDPGSKTELRKLINWGAGPRASQYLVLAAKARAALDGRLTPAEEDVRAVAVPVLSHRILISFAAEAEGIKVGEIIKQLLE